MGYEIELNNIRKKFNYDDEMMKYIRPAFLAFVNHYSKYGYFDRVYNLFMTTRVLSYYAIPHNTVEKDELLRKYSDHTDEEINMKTVYEVGELLCKVNKNNVEKTIIIKRNADAILSTLIHELEHSFVTSSVVEEKDGVKFFRSGFSETRLSDHKYNINIPLEEGFTEYDTKMICIENGYRYNPAYENHVKYVESFMTVPEIYDMVTRYRVEGFDGIDKKDLEWFKGFKFTILSYDNAYEAKDFFEKKELLNLNKESIKRKIKSRF